jgi:DNA repair exonuclease SbcCD ATPase subunit
MPIEFDESMQQRLKQAEMAERELARLQPLAEEAANLRHRQERAAKFEDSLRRRDQCLEEAQQMVASASSRQEEISSLLENASNAVASLFAAMKDVKTRRRRAAEALAVVDRVDYDIELEEVGEEQRQYDRDPRGLAYALAARHGDSRVQLMLDEMDPGFDLLRNCNMGDTLHRDVSNFVLDHVNAKEQPGVRPATFLKTTVVQRENQMEEEMEAETAVSH